MAGFYGNRGGHTPATNADNWVLHADADGDMGMVTMINWGGRGTTSTGYRTRWARPTTNAGSTPTGITVQADNPKASALCFFGTYATAATYGTDPASELFAQDWNVLGGGGVLVLPIGGEWKLVYSATDGYAQVGCNNVAGTDAGVSNYGVQWRE